ncbi:MULTISPECIES: XRE family transcriptional regulator [Acinetobacter]|uniref:HTH cro/C1-type domain-containing protein n=1 Tax=Acinetobacter higginsii TaxID=70347 RepID=N9RJP4_9GAMM|nr:MULTISPECIES: S24 family peptidase [Acinetobacter]ENX58184.1 hypothetical protein F902_02584 [Acinetobacter higginsii]MCJ0829715.1 peptidase S24 [Acinetobacter sp. NIPH1876]
MIGARIKEERTRLDLNQPDFGAIAGASKRTVIEWEKDNSSPTAVQLSALSEVGVDVTYVITGNRLNKSVNMKNDFADEFDLVNVYDVAISAGHGSICAGEAQPVSRLAFRKDWLHRHGFYAKDLIIVYATGDSMFPTIQDKEPLLVNTLDHSLTDGFIYVIRTGEHFWVKRIQRQIDGSILLISDNKTYPPMPLDLNEASDIEIMGKWIPPSRGTFY